MMNRYPMVCAVLVALVASLATPTAQAQWDNRYTKLDDFGHHVYLEQHELPILAHGPVDPAPSPDGRALAFAGGATSGHGISGVRVTVFLVIFVPLLVSGLFILERLAP